MSNDALEHARQKIDEEIEALQERIRSLCSSRNALTPIHRLPPEVTTQIFRWVQLLFPGKLEWCASVAVLFPRWIQVAHVSRHWRSIVLGSEALCSTLLTHSLKYSSQMLQLSRSSALTLIDSVGADYLWQNPALQELVLAALPRVRNLWLNPWSSSFILSHLDDSNLALEDLFLRQWKTFHPKLFPKSLRRLQHRLCMFESHEWLSRLSNLTELSIIAGPDSVPIPVDGLLDILDGMPRLLSLELSSMLTSALTRINRTSPIRPRLNRLKLCNVARPVVECIPWFTFAPRFSIIIDLFLPELGQAPIAEWLPLFVGHIGQQFKASSMVIRRAKLIWDQTHDAGNPVMQLAEDFGEKPCFQLTLLSEPDWDLSGTWLKSVKAFPVENIESLTVNALWDVDYWRSSPWRDLHSLRQLTIQNDLASMAYLKNFTTKLGGVPGHLSFLSLEELSLRGVSYGRDLKTKLQAALNTQKESGQPLRKLVFHNSNISEDAVSQLAQVVGVVEQHRTKKKAKKAYHFAEVDD